MQFEVSGCKIDAQIVDSNEYGCKSRAESNARSVADVGTQRPCWYDATKVDTTGNCNPGASATSIGNDNTQWSQPDTQPYLIWMVCTGVVWVLMCGGACANQERIRRARAARFETYTTYHPTAQASAATAVQSRWRGYQSRSNKTLFGQTPVATATAVPAVAVATAVPVAAQGVKIEMTATAQAVPVGGGYGTRL